MVASGIAMTTASSAPKVPVAANIFPIVNAHQVAGTAAARISSDQYAIEAKVFIRGLCSRQLVDHRLRGFLDYRLEGNRAFRHRFIGVLVFLAALPRNGAFLRIPDLQELADVRLLGLNNAETERAESVIGALLESCQIQLGEIAAAGRVSDLLQCRATEDTRISVFVIHLLVILCEPRLVDGTERLRQRQHAQVRPLAL